MEAPPTAPLPRAPLPKVSRPAMMPAAVRIQRQPAAKPRPATQRPAAVSSGTWAEAAAAAITPTVQYEPKATPAPAAPTAAVVSAPPSEATVKSGDAYDAFMASMQGLL